MGIEKAEHFTLGFGIGFIVTIISSAMNLLEQPNLGILCTSLAFGAGVYRFIKSKKENKENFNLWDLLAITIGGSLYLLA